MADSNVADSSMSDTMDSMTDSMAHNTNVTTVGSMERIGRVSNRGHGGSEGLSLRDTSVLSLERLGDRLVRCLASRTDSSMDQRSSMNQGSSMNSSMNNRASMNNRGSMNNWSSMNYWSSMNKRGSSDNGGLWVDCLAVINDLSDVAVKVIGVVVDMLDPSIRKSYRVRTLTIACSIIRFTSIEV